MQSRSDYRPWRLVGTALSFAVFGLFGLLLGGIFFPVMRVLPLGAARRRALGARVVVRCFHGFVEFMRVVGVLTYSFDGRERLGRPGQLILANHPSLIDVVFLIGFTPRACCVVKAALWRNPFTGGVVNAAGYVPNFPTDAMIDGASERLRAGESMIMFPEGTRTRPGEPMQFHRGAAAVAVRAARVITPVFIAVEPPTLGKHEPWYRIPPRRPHFRLQVGDDIDPAPYQSGGSPPKAIRQLHADLLKTFLARLAGSANGR